MEEKLTNILRNNRSLYYMIILMVILQPILDIITFFTNYTDYSIISTIVRFTVFMSVSIYGYLISTNKKRYFSIFVFFLAFFSFHVFFNYQTGYISLKSDILMYLRVIQMFIYMVVFDEMIKISTKSHSNHKQHLSSLLLRLMFMNLWIISLSIFLSYLMGIPNYTYSSANGEIGVKGWFLIGNAQSVIILLLSVFSMIYSLNKKNKITLPISIILVVLNLFYFGTRLTYYGIFVLFLSIAILSLLSREIKIRKKVTILFLLFATMLIVSLAKTQSPMYINRVLESQSFNNWQAEIDGIEESLPKNDEDTQNNVINEDVSMEEVVEEQVQIDETITDETINEEIAFNKEYYTSVYNLYSKPLVNVFGIEAVAEKYDYSLDSEVLINNRKNKVIASLLVYESQPLGVKMFGFEQNDYFIDGVLYDVENDFAGIFFSYGFVGFALYLGFILYFLLRGLVNYFFGSEYKYDIVLGGTMIALIIIIGAAQFSGNVFKQVNVSFYFALTLTLLNFNSNSIISVVKKKGL